MRVLYIEDTLSDADIARRTLVRTAPDIELIVVTTLAEGLKCLEKSDYYDVLLTDLNLPDGSGLEALTNVRERRLPLAVVIITGSGGHDSAVAAFKASADDYLIKEGDYLERLPRILRSALARFRSKGVNRNLLTLRVLYVEHNSFDIDLMHRHLAQHAPHIHLAAVTGTQEALALLPAGPEQAADFDILLLDNRLPGMDGLDFIRLLRQERKLDIPIVLITGQGSEMVAARALHLGVEDYLPKHEGYLFEIPATLEKAQRQAELVRERISLKQTSLRLSHLLAASPMVLYNLRLTGNVPRSIWVSENIERLFGYTV
ncbi:MAG: response regulator, partial [Betaproteobacteria bacterium]|nr:response regulator [Betaproteobacteria bacterium]